MGSVGSGDTPVRSFLPLIGHDTAADRFTSKPCAQTSLRPEAHHSVLWAADTLVKYRTGLLAEPHLTPPGSRRTTTLATSNSSRSMNAASPSGPNASGNSVVPAANVPM